MCKSSICATRQYKAQDKLPAVQAHGCADSDSRTVRGESKFPLFMHCGTFARSFVESSDQLGVENTSWMNNGTNKVILGNIKYCSYETSSGTTSR